MLFPQMNKYRNIINLNGYWKMKCVNDDYLPNIPLNDYMFMAVPASMNDIVVDKNIKEYVGKIVFETDFSFPINSKKKYYLYVGATSSKSDIYLNGEYLASIINGYYPIEILLNKLEEVNRLSIVIDNRLSFQTFPVGEIKNNKQVIQHDFYNFTGIHRDVLILEKPINNIEDIIVNTVCDNDYRKIKVQVTGVYNDINYKVLDKEDNVILISKDSNLNINNPILWDTNNPYLYKLVVTTDCDMYIQKFGIRKVEVNNGKILLNGNLIYLKGFGMHEDSFIIGKGNNPAVNIRNFELLKWINANSFRTSHYPYADDWYDLADEYGFLVINEVPAVGMNWWNDSFTMDRINDESKEIHKQLIKQLIERDKNHPSVIMLSVANEAATHEYDARKYFEDIVNYSKKLTDLPITIVEFSKYEDSLVGDLVDVICLNRYYGWYEDHGDVFSIRNNFEKELKLWFNKYHKPIIITEFGSDTIEGLHSVPSETFSEEWQLEYIREHVDLFKELDFIVGEHVWNFADFKTKEGIKRIRGNRKGVFTKDRQPKMVAHYLKEHWNKR